MAQPATVLVLAELDDADRVAVERACTDAGFSPVVESLAEAAISKLTAKRFDAFVVHLGTPGAALACMRTRGKLLRVRIPVVALVDEESDGAFARAYRAGADEVLPMGHPQWITARLRALPKPSMPQPGHARGDAVVADADRSRAEVVERVLRDAGFRVEVAVDGFSTRLQAGRPALKVAVVDASLDDVSALIAQARAKGARCAWVVRCRPEQLDELRLKLAGESRVSVVSAYGPPEDVLFETNRLIEPRPSDGRADRRLLHGTIVRLGWGADGDGSDVGYTYNVSSQGLFVRTLVAPSADTVKIDVTPPGGDRAVHLECKVVWRREFGTTRKEPVPAGFGVQVTGGDADAWAEACPRVPSLRPPLSPAEASEASPGLVGASVAKAPPRKISQPRLPAVRAVSGGAGVDGAPAGASAPGDGAAHRRAAQPSVEEMLQTVLAETIPGEVEGAAPLGIHGESVVELAGSGEVASSEDRLTMDEPFRPEPPVVARPPGGVPADAVPGASSSSEAPAPRGEPPDITPSSLGFDLSDDVISLPPSLPPVAPAAESPHGARAGRGEGEPTSAFVESASEQLPAPAVSADGYGDTVRPDPSLDVNGVIPQVPAPPRLPVTGSPAPPHAMATPSPRPAATNGASAHGGRAAFAATMLAGAPAASGPPELPSAPSSTEPAGADTQATDTEQGVPTRKTSPVVWVAIAVVVGGVAALVVPKGERGSGTESAVATRPAPSTPAPSAAPIVAAPPAVAEPVASAAPPAVAEPAPSAAPPAVAAPAPSAAPPAAALPAASGDEADEAALRTLQKGYGFMYVASPHATNVYVYGLLAGTTNQRIVTKCGPRFLRLGSAPGVWQGEGFVQIVKCGAFTRVTAPE